MLNVFLSERFNIVSVFSHLCRVNTYITLIVAWKYKGKIPPVWGTRATPSLAHVTMAVGSESSCPTVLPSTQVPSGRNNSEFYPPNPALVPQNYPDAWGKGECYYRYMQANQGVSSILAHHNGDILLCEHAARQITVHMPHVTFKFLGTNSEK